MLSLYIKHGIGFCRTEKADVNAFIKWTFCTDKCGSFLKGTIYTFGNHEYRLDYLQNRYNNCIFTDSTCVNYNIISIDVISEQTKYYCRQNYGSYAIW